jgi:DNA-binding CsgD family transcriptional regulator
LLIFSVFIFLALSYTKAVDVALAVSWTIPLILLTLVFLHMNNLAGAHLVRMTNTALSFCLQAFFYILFARAAQQDERRGVFFFACYLTGISLGTAGGALLYTRFSGFLDKDGILLFLTALVTITVSLTMILARKAESFATSGIFYRLHEGQPVKTDIQIDSMIGETQRVWGHRLAADHGLSHREEEVLSYLLMGRNRPYIRDALFISINTVNTHTKSIYTKLNVHSQQELIDLMHRLP